MGTVRPPDDAARGNASVSHVSLAACQLISIVIAALEGSVVPWKERQLFAKAAGERVFPKTRSVTKSSVHLSLFGGPVPAGLQPRSMRHVRPDAVDSEARLHLANWKCCTRLEPSQSLFPDTNSGQPNSAHPISVPPISNVTL